MTTPQRVARYYEKLQQFWALQSIVYRPSYNGGKEWDAHEKLNDWLRKEADELFCLGVSVYH
jgi:hypothetical protein